MPRESFDRELHHLQDEVLLLGSMVEQALIASVDSLRNRDLEAAHRIYRDDHLVNEKRFAIENAILILIATQQPMAHDLRILAAILEVITELERMGDYAKGIAKVNWLLGEDSTPMPIREITRMVELSVSMLHRALSAFIAEDSAMARTIPLEDDLVDDLYNRVYQTLVSTMISDPKTIDHANYLLWVAHNLERTADRVTNICERTVFIATGELMELESEDEEDDDESLDIE
jgi:phosphate transport system protein